MGRIVANPAVMGWTGCIFDFKVLLADGEIIEFRNTLADVLRWETNKKQPFTRAVGLNGLIYLAFISARRQGLIEQSRFEDWLEKGIEDFTLDEITRDEDGVIVPATIEEDDELSDYATGETIADPTLPDQSGD